jgi:peptidoglycan-associated lipoprotein
MSTTLTWQTTNATDVSIDGIGAVQPNGTQQVTPTDSTTYHLVAKGAGGTQEATARVTVNAPPPPPATTSLTDEELFARNVKDVYFDYDSDAIRPDQQASVQGDASFLSQHSGIPVTVEGHCDERGSTEYNLALGDRRANSVKNALTAAGVSASRIKTISYGKEKPPRALHHHEVGTHPSCRGGDSTAPAYWGFADSAPSSLESTGETRELPCPPSHFVHNGFPPFPPRRACRVGY